MSAGGTEEDLARGCLLSPNRQPERDARPTAGIEGEAIEIAVVDEPELQGAGAYELDVIGHLVLGRAQMQYQARAFDRAGEIDRRRSGLGDIQSEPAVALTYVKAFWASSRDVRETG